MKRDQSKVEVLYLRKPSQKTRAKAKVVNFADNTLAYSDKPELARMYHENRSKADEPEE